MKTKWLIAGLLVAAGLTFAGGLLYGDMTGRWGASDQGLQAAERLNGLPEQCGRWVMRDEVKLDETAQNMLQCYGHVGRNYFDPNSGRLVQMSVMVGPTGPISEHTAEVCMPSREYSQVGARLKRSMDGHEFWYVDFQRNDVSGTRVRVYWAWSTGGPWEAPPPGLKPGGARVRYAGEPYLYKLQLQTVLPAGFTSEAAPDTPDPAERFLREALPAMQSCLTEPSES